MKNIYLQIIGSLLILLAFEKPSHAQTTYFKLIDSASSYYQQKEYEKAGNYYIKSFNFNGKLATQTDRYNAGCSWSLANKPNHAFVELNAILSGKGIIESWNDPSEFHQMLIVDPDFKNLYADKRWKKLIATSIKRKTLFESKQHKEFVKELAIIRKEDQGLRLKLDTIRKDKGLNSVEEMELFKKINFSDSINLAKILNLINKEGWLSPEQVGYAGNQTIFLVIQHANLAVQEKYLPIMRTAVKNKKALPKDLALLEDRVAMRSGKKQIYGSQMGIDRTGGIYYLYPVIDPDHLDNRRAKVALEPIANYLKAYRLIWDLELYKQELPQLETKLKIN